MPVGSSWVTMAPMPLPGRYAHYIRAVGGLLYLTGGEASGIVGSSAYAYDPLANAWSAALAAMPTAQARGVSAVVGGKLWVLCGVNSTGSPVNKVMVYDPAANTWTTPTISSVPTPPTGRAYCSGGVVDGKIYVAGGSGGTSNSNAAQLIAWDANNSGSTGYITDLAALPTPVYDGAGSVSGGRLYIFGGVNPSSGVTDAVQRYDPATNTWATLTAMPNVRTRHAAALGDDGRIYIAGGRVAGASSSSPSVWAYDPTTDTWDASSPPSLPGTAWEYGRLTNLGGTLAFTGGSPTSPQHYQLTITGPSWTPPTVGQLWPRLHPAPPASVGQLWPRG